MSAEAVERLQLSVQAKRRRPSITDTSADMAERPSYYLINAISRSGSTYFGSLFDALPGVCVLPFEMPVNRDLTVRFLTDAQFAAVEGAAGWLEATALDYYLSAFASNPFQRSQGRPRRPEDPALRFDLDRFREELSRHFAQFASVADAYRQTWDLILQNITVDGRCPYPAQPGQLYVNQFATYTLLDFDRIANAAQDICDLYALYVMRDPLENVGSLINHWRLSAPDPYFLQMAFARWELAIYAIARNCLRRPDRCACIIYDPDPLAMQAQLARLDLPLARLAAAQPALAPSLAGIPLRGQSYKEKAGGAVKKEYDYAAMFGAANLAWMTQRTRDIYRRLGIDTLNGLVGYRQADAAFAPIADLEAEAFDTLQRCADDCLKFANSYSNNFYRNVAAACRREGMARFGWNLLKALRANFAQRA